MMRPFLIVAAACALVAGPAAAQRPVSFGAATTVPGTSPTSHAMATLELGGSRFPLRVRADLAVLQLPTSVSSQWGVSVLLVPLQRAFSPYLVGGLALETDRMDGPYGEGWSGARVGLGLRYRIDNRVLFAEGVRHTGVRRNLVSVGIQF